MNRSDTRDYELHRLVVEHIERDPKGVLSRALRTIQNRDPHQYYHEWRRIIELGPARVIETLLDKSERSSTLRSASPFAGVLSQEERLRVLERLARHGRT